MSDSRKNLKLQPDAFERLESLKPDGITWSQFANELADAYESSPDTESASNDTSDVGPRLETIEELLESVPRDTAREIESRFG